MGMLLKSRRVGTRVGPKGAMAVAWLALLVGCGVYEGGPSGPAITGSLGGSVPTGLSQSEQVAAFAATVHPVVKLYCAGGCHDTGGLGAPFLFAHDNPGTAYTVITEAGKVSLSSPPQSRVVRRPAADLHQCGTQCIQIGAEMLAAVEAWAALVEAAGDSGDQVAVEGIASQEMDFSDGVVQENGERYSANLIAFYDFTEGSGDVAFDTSGVEPAMDLTLGDNVEWMSSWGIVLADGRAYASRDTSIKLFDRIAKPGVGTQQYSVEMWANNENTTQEEARLVTYSRSSGSRNFSLEQQQYQYEFRNRSVADESGSSGKRALITYDVDQDAQETLQHVVITYDQVNGRRIYVDGEWTEDQDTVDGARLWDWNDSAVLTIGSEREGSGDEYWRGQMRLLGIYSQALTLGQIRQNFLAGVGKSLRLEFSLEEWTGTDAKVEFAVTELDSYSYLFCQPTFTGSRINGMRVKNMRVQVNPTETDGPSPQGQAFSTLDELITGTRHQVSRNCAIVPQIDGPDSDSFALIFEELNIFSDPVSETLIDFAVSDVTLPRPPDTGFRDFARIDATMRSLTSVDPLEERAVDPDDTDLIYDSFQELKQQLPATSDPRSIVSSHQIGVTNLAFEYCVELVDRPNLRSAVFGSEFESGTPSFFESDVATAFGNATLADLLTQRLVDHMLGARELENQPLRADVIADVDQLRDELADPDECGPCDAERTLSIAKGLCTAVLASAAVMLH